MSFKFCKKYQKNLTSHGFSLVVCYRAAQSWLNHFRALTGITEWIYGCEHTYKIKLKHFLERNIQIDDTLHANVLYILSFFFSCKLLVLRYALNNGKKNAFFLLLSDWIFQFNEHKKLHSK